MAATLSSPCRSKATRSPSRSLSSHCQDPFERDLVRHLARLPLDPAVGCRAPHPLARIDSKVHCHQRSSRSIPKWHPTGYPAPGPTRWNSWQRPSASWPGMQPSAKIDSPLPSRQLLSCYVCVVSLLTRQTEIRNTTRDNRNKQCVPVSRAERPN